MAQPIRLDRLVENQKVGDGSSSATGPSPSLERLETKPLVRGVVERLLHATQAFRGLAPEKRRQLNAAMNRVCHTAVELLREEALQEERLRSSHDDDVGEMSLESRSPLALAQAAGDSLSGRAAASIGKTTRQVLNAVSFPRFVGELINGVFKAMLDSNQQQMDAYVELLNNVAASTEGFADAHFGAGRARLWLAERYPDSFETEEMESFDDEDDEEVKEVRLRLKEGAAMPTEGRLRTDLGLSDEESVPRGHPESLVPLVRRALARQKQQMLASMVTMGMQRIVIDSGKIQAAMRFHIDTRSAAHADEGSRFDFQNQVKASGKYGFGPWGVKASMTNTIGYVSTQRTQTTEEVNTDLDLNSSVELNFRTDYVPLDKMAARDRVTLIRANTLNPAAASSQAEAARQKRAKQAKASDEARRKAIDDELQKKIEPKPSSSKQKIAQGPSAQALEWEALESPGKGGRTTTPSRGMDLSMTPHSSRAKETCWHRERIRHSAPQGFLGPFPEESEGRFTVRFEVPPGFKYSSYRVASLGLSPGAFYKVEGRPKRGSEGPQELHGTWSHPPFGQVDLEVRVYVSANGEAETRKIGVETPHWRERIKEAISQEVPVELDVRGQAAEHLHRAIEQMKLAGSLSDDPEGFLTPFALAAMAQVGMVHVYTVARDAVDKGYVVEKTALHVQGRRRPMGREPRLILRLRPS